jgi:hypothetical protein
LFKDIIWIEDIVTLPPFLTNFGVDMAGFMDLHKMVGKSTFLAFSNAPNESEFKGGRKKCRVKTSIFTGGTGFEFTKDV